jgi:hypothetical protein
VAVVKARLPITTPETGAVDLQAYIVLARPLMKWQVAAVVAAPVAAKEGE